MGCSSSKVTRTVVPEIVKETMPYATKDGQVLYLDKIYAPSVNSNEKKPVFLHSIGGGWATAIRDDISARSFLNYLAMQGYVVISIDYRLGLKMLAEKKLNATGVDIYLKSIELAVEDLFDATAFILEHANEWNIDPKQIIAGGGSAGATNSIVAEHHISNNTELFKKRLPMDFNFAGIISMAGALWLPGENTASSWTKKPCPILLFHGSKDQLVTYDEVHAPGWSGYGPVSLYKQFAKENYPIWFYDFPEADHAISMIPMFENRAEIMTFLKKFVKDKEELSIHTVEKNKVVKNFEYFLRKYHYLLVEALKEK